MKWLNKKKLYSEAIIDMFNVEYSIVELVGLLSIYVEVVKFIDEA